jgi:hypothetical protein
VGDYEMPGNGIALGSSYSHMACNDTRFLAFCSHELDIRVGHGHDLLQLVRNAVVLHHHYSIQYGHARGLAQMEKIAQMQSKASKEKASTIASYSKNWRKIQILLQIIGQTDDSNRLKGLKELNASEDARYFSSLGNQTGPFLADQNEGVSWIWKVAMLSAPLSGSSSLTAVSREEQWASEGNYQDSNEWLFLHDFQLGVCSGFIALTRVSA